MAETAVIRRAARPLRAVWPSAQKKPDLMGDQARRRVGRFDWRETLEAVLEAGDKTIEGNGLS